MKKQVTAIACMLVSYAGVTFAQPGTLDLSFGGLFGFTTTGFGGHDNVSSMVIQSNGKILVAGSTYNNTDADFAIARYNVNGTPDNTFGGDGKVTTGFGATEYGSAVAIQSNGKIVVAGYSISADYEGDFILARYNANGTLDNTFSGDGKVRTDFGADDKAYAVAIQADGKIVVAGHTNAHWPYTVFALARYNTNGTLDNTFGRYGKADFIAWGSAYCQSLAIQSDGKILVAGYTQVAFANVFALARYNTNGTGDNTFGVHGFTTAQFGGGEIGDDDYGRSMAIQSNGKIVVAGETTEDGDSDFALARFNTNGTLDITFGGDGRVSTGFGDDDGALAVAIQSNGKIVAAGSSFAGGSPDFALARYKSNGIRDNTFSGDGLVLTDFLSLYNWETAFGIGIQKDGKIVVAGDSYDGADDDFIVARYIGDNVAAAITGETVAGVDNMADEGSVLLYPQPAKDILHIRNMEGAAVKTLAIADNSGRIMRTTTVINSFYNWNIAGLSSGMYHLIIDDRKKKISLKFVKE